MVCGDGVVPVFGVASWPRGAGGAVAAGAVPVRLEQGG